MAESDNPEVPKLLELTWALPAAVAMFAVAITLYALNFGGYDISDSPEQWGQLGDYLGGLVNPFIGLITVLLLVSSLRQNQIALAQSREELKHARAAIEQATATQRLTEEALKEQVAIASHSRDMNNAIALWEAFRAAGSDSETKLDSYSRSGIYNSKVSDAHFVTLQECAQKVKEMSGVIEDEHKRILSKYSNSDS